MDNQILRGPPFMRTIIEIQMNEDQVQFILDENCHLPNLTAIAKYSYDVELDWVDWRTVSLSGQSNEVFDLINNWNPYSVRIVAALDEAPL